MLRHRLVRAGGPRRSDPARPFALMHDRSASGDEDARTDGTSNGGGLRSGEMAIWRVASVNDRVDALAEAFNVEDVPDLSAERERLLAEARRFGELVRANPEMLARFRAARAVDAPTDDDAIAIIRNVTPPDEDAMRLAARAAIELLRARGVNGIPLQEDNPRIDRLVAEFDVPPPQI